MLTECEKVTSYKVIINEKRKCDSVLEIGNRKSLFYPIKNQLKLFTFQLFDFPLSRKHTKTLATFHPIIILIGIVVIYVELITQLN